VTATGPVVIELVTVWQRWMAVLGILAVFVVAVFVAVHVAGTADTRDARAEEHAAVFRPGGRVLHAVHGVGTVGNEPGFAGLVVVEFDIYRATAQTRRWVERIDLAPATPDDEAALAKLTDRGVRLFITPPPRTPSPEPGVDPWADRLAGFTACGDGWTCRYHSVTDPSACHLARCCPSCPVNPERTTRR